MDNPFAGEVSITLNGDRHVMRLTLGALAALEAQLEADSLIALVARFERGEQRVEDIISLLAAGLKGGGWDGDERDLVDGDIDGGVIAASRAAALLLTRAFSMPEQGAYA